MEGPQEWKLAPTTKFRFGFLEPFKSAISPNNTVKLFMPSQSWGSTLVCGPSYPVGQAWTLFVQVL
ncbi:hypothetical protein N7507_007947 [Penicillium longicatenatum]|nr:hypothetical protein N7507_007947 [Penicillium longicatenatum]